MILHSSGFLGLALGDRSITCTELTVSGDRRTARRMAVFSIPEGQSLEQAGPVGQALALFLRQHGFRASRAVVGVPARWLLTSEREVPPTGPEELRSILRLHAERASVAESGEIVFDYTGEPDTSKGGKVLLVGMLRQRLDQIVALLDAAGITVSAVTSASMALARGMRGDDSQFMLVLGPSGAELAWRNRGETRLLRHVPVASLNGHGLPALGPLGAELRRAVALAPMNGSAASRELLLWDGLGLSEGQRTELAGRLGVPLRESRGLSLLGIEGPPAGDDAPPDRFAPALALALAGCRGDVPLDLKHSRLAPPRRRSFDRRAVWTVTLAVVAAVSIASLYWNVAQRKIELNRLKVQLDSMAPDIKSAELMLERVNFARGFFDGRPAMLECLLELTLAFRDDEPIWVTGFTLRENGKGQLTGKAATQKIILQLCDRLQANPRFSEARTLQMTEVNVAGGRGKEQSFTIVFTFLGLE